MWTRIMDAVSDAVGGRKRLCQQSGPYRLEVLVDGTPAPTFFHEGESYVLGSYGQRYVLRITNHSAHRIEVIVSVDGRDVMDGEPAELQAPARRGYLVPARDSLEIEGFRVSCGQVAAFRFTSTDRSYAARRGSARHVGVIGVAVFGEEAPLLPRGMCQKSWPDEQAAAAAPCCAASRSRGLGTAFGEALDSPVYEVPFHRQGSRPVALLGVRYDDAAGLRELGIEPCTCRRERFWDDTDRRRSAEPFPGRRYARPPKDWEP